MQTKFEIIKFSHGELVIAKSGKNFSTGLLHLRPKSSLEKHNRPVDEQLVQIYEASVIKLYDGEGYQEVELKEGDDLLIPANQYHMHTNPTDSDSITAWRFDGDITEIIQKQREKLK